MNKMITKSDLVNALKACGLNMGDVILVHCDISLLGKSGNSLQETLEIYKQALEEVIGPQGTLAVPAFFHEYSRKKIPFDIKRSPVSKDLGLFSAYITKNKNAHRSLNPIASIAAIGEKAEYICEGQTATAYGIDSGFDRLYRLNSKIVFIGVDLKAMTFTHYAEYQVGVPHLYNKYYETPIYNDGEKIDLPVTAYVRYRHFEVDIDPPGNTEKFEAAGLVKKTKLGNDYIRVLSTHEVFNFLKVKLQKDFFYLLKNKPNFIENKIPLV